MPFKSRRQLTGGRWSEEERKQLWQLRNQNQRIVWEKFRDQFFPRRSTVALAKAYSDMKLMRGKLSPQQGDQHVRTTRRAPQGNKRKHSGEGTTEHQPKKRQTSPSESYEESRSRSGDSDTEDSDAGDIPYEDGVPRRILLNPLRNRPVRTTRAVTSRACTGFQVPGLAKQNGKGANSPATSCAENTTCNSSRKQATKPRIRLTKAQIPPNDSIKTTPSAPMTVQDQSSVVNQSPAQSPGSTSPTGQQSTTTKTMEQFAMCAASELPDESYAFMSRSLQLAADVFVQYPRIKSRAEKAERENAEKDTYIQEIQSSHKAEVLGLHDRVAVQNKMMQEQRGMIEALRVQLKMRENQNVEIQRQAACIKDLELGLGESKKALQSLRPNIEHLNKWNGNLPKGNKKLASETASNFLDQMMEYNKTRLRL